MALTSCRECGGQVSDEAKACPHCGAYRPGNQEWNGWGVDWKSEATYGGFPLVHVAFGRDRRGKIRVAKGVIAVGQFAVGLITIAQFGVGLLFGLGQIIGGLTALAQVAVTPYFAIGQLATGYVAIGQLVLAYYGLCQYGFAKFIWSTSRQDPEAVEFFLRLAQEWLSIVTGGVVL